MENSMQTDNLQDSNPESVEEQVMDNNLDTNDFFERLDNEVNGAIYDEVEQPQPEIEQQTSQLENPVSEQPRQSDEADSLQKRYSDSSREAKRLNGKLQEIEPYMPVLDAMREDPNLISHIRNYFEGGGQQPKNIKERLGLDEDFEFDYNEAMNTPDSESGQLFQATVDEVVNRRLSNFAQKQKGENQRLAQESSFRSRYKLPENEWEDLVAYAKNHTLSLDDIYYLKNRETSKQNIANQTKQEVLDQMKNVRQRPVSVAASGSNQAPEQSPDDQIFDAILGSDHELETAFSI
jgi:hypothetical protein